MSNRRLGVALSVTPRRYTSQRAFIGHGLDTDCGPTYQAIDVIDTLRRP